MMSYGTTWSSFGSFDSTKFNSNVELVNYLSLFTVDVVADGADPETREGSYCVYESGIDHIDINENIVTLVVGFRFYGTPGFCSKAELTKVWSDLSSKTGLKLGQLTKE